jgi:hypothetical protein
MMTQGYTATLVATTLAIISRSSLYYRKRPRGSRADQTYGEQIVTACGEKLAQRMLASFAEAGVSALFGWRSLMGSGEIEIAHQQSRKPQ